MRMLTCALLAVAMGLAAVGCQDPAPQQADEWLANKATDDSIANAVLTQHTLYPYHFVANSAELNQLGRQDMEVLAGFYKDNPGSISVRRGDVEPRLYDGRIKAVQSALARGGVEVARVAIVDELPAGDGTCSDRMVTILQKLAENKAQGGQSSGSTSITDQPVNQSKGE